MKTHLLLALWLLSINLLAQKQPALLIQTGHSQIAKATWSPDSSYLLTYSSDGTLKLWDREFNILRKYVGHSDGVNSAAFFPDGQHFVSASSDRTVALWHIEKGLITRQEDRVAPMSFNVVHVTRDGQSYYTRGFNFYTPEGKFWSKTGEFQGVKNRESTDNFLQKEIHEESCKQFYSTIGITAARFSRDGKYIATGSQDKNVRIWSTEGGFIRSFSTPFGKHGYISELDFSPDGQHIVVAGLYNKELYVYTVEGELIYTLYGHSSYNYGVGYLPDGRIYSSSHDGSVALWDTKGNKLHQKNLYSGGGGVCSGISRDGKYIATGFGALDPNLQVIYLVSTNDLSETQIGKTNNNERVHNIAVNHDGSRVATVTFDSNDITLWGPQGQIAQWDGQTTMPLSYGNTITFSPDNKHIAAGFNDNTIGIWTVDGVFVKSLIGHTSKVTKVDYSPDSRFLVSTSDDSETIIWNVETGHRLSLVQKDEEWVMFTPDGLFDASRNGGRLAAIIDGLKVYGLDQFALKNNRPDKILQYMGIQNSALSEHYYDRYLLRLKKAGLTEADLSSDMHTPTTEIVAKKQTAKLLELSFAMEDKLYPLKSYQIYVNNVPLFGASGKALTGNQATVTETVELIQGENKIEVSCINQRGTESIRALVRSKYSVASPGELYFLGFGVSSYQNPSLNLQYAHKDANDLAAQFVALEGQAYTKVHTKVLTDAAVTPANIKAAKSFLANAKPDDTFVLFIAGHGVYDTNKAGTYYYLTHNANLATLSTTAINFELIEDLLHGIAPRRKLFFMDTCESGELDETVERDYLASAQARGIKARGFKAKPTNAKSPVKAKRPFLFQKNRFIYNDMARRSGAIVFSSSKGGQYSYESAEIENGFFTQEILNALGSEVADADKNGQLSMNELRNYVSQAVGKATNGLQTPTVDRDNIFINIDLPLPKK